MKHITWIHHLLADKVVTALQRHTGDGSITSISASSASAATLNMREIVTESDFSREKLQRLEAFAIGVTYGITLTES
jgi:hypothetical protein